MSGLYALPFDPSNCDREPIHIVRAVQSFAVLLAFDAREAMLLHYSENAQQELGLPPDFLTLNPAELLGPELWNRLVSNLADNRVEELNPLEIATLNGRRLSRPLHLVAHVHQGVLILEFEPVDTSASPAQFYQRMDQAIQRVQQVRALPHLFRTVVLEIRRLTGYDRVMLYRFDAEYNGEVIAEDRLESYEPYLNLRYPATDIPRQARELYLKNQIRIIADTEAEPALIHPPLHPRTGQPLDLTYSVARAVSPVHIQYLRNMGVRSTMSIAIIVDGRLWGLIACHHGTPKRIDYRQRQFIRFIGTVISGHLSLQAVNAYRSQVLEANIMRSQLVERMQQREDALAGLTEASPNVLDLNTATGAALLYNGEVRTLGETPSADELTALREWLEEQDFSPLFYTDSLAKQFPPAAAYAAQASGLLAIRPGTDPAEYILWFKPELVRTVHWGGNPTKTYEQLPDGSRRLTPRNSFAKWSERVRQTSEAWSRQERDVARALLDDIRELAVRQYQQVRSENRQLTESKHNLESFNYSVTHDLRTPLRSIEGFSQILREEYGDQLDEYGQFVVNSIISSALKMEDLISNLLTFSQMGERAIHPVRTDIVPLVAEIAADLRRDDPESVGALNIQYPEELCLTVDPGLLHNLLQNLLSNAVKYTRGQPERTIRIAHQREGDFDRLSIADTGIGFDPQYAERIFEVFTRLATEDSFPGTGVGLAIVKRIMEKHGGQVSVESTPGVGTTFYCDFPTTAVVANN